MFITINHLPNFQIGSIPNALPSRTEGRAKTMEEMERDYIVHILEQCNGKIVGKGGAAESLGMNASTLNSRIKKLGIEKEKIKFKGGES
jgi:transcriptional regulator with GAF, ATPase, and Fis domain